ncbi:MAG: PadR family transcriptional regulator [Chloroflexota bacterium]
MTADHRHLLLLGLLRRHEMHGYQLNAFLDGELAACSDLKKPTAYFLLNKMAEAGWLAQEESRRGKRPVRRVSSLTAAGEAAFYELLRANLSSHTPTYFADDVGLAMLDALPPEEAGALLAQRRAAIAEALAKAQAAPAHRGTTQWAIEHQIDHLAHELAWVDRIVARLKERQERMPHEQHPAG